MHTLYNTIEKALLDALRTADLPYEFLDSDGTENADFDVDNGLPCPGSDSKISHTSPIPLLPPLVGHSKY
jgi:hypothetical protein